MTMTSTLALELAPPINLTSRFPFAENPHNPLLLGFLYTIKMTEPKLFPCKGFGANYLFLGQELHRKEKEGVQIFVLS